MMSVRMRCKYKRTYILYVFELEFTFIFFSYYLQKSFLCNVLSDRATERFRTRTGSILVKVIHVRKNVSMQRRGSTDSLSVHCVCVGFIPELPSTVQRAIDYPRFFDKMVHSIIGWIKFHFSVHRLSLRPFKFLAKSMSVVRRSRTGGAPGLVVPFHCFGYYTDGVYKILCISPVGWIHVSTIRHSYVETMRRIHLLWSLLHFHTYITTAIVSLINFCLLRRIKSPLFPVSVLPHLNYITLQGSVSLIHCSTSFTYLRSTTVHRF